MSTSPWQRDREALEGELGTTAYGTLLQGLKRKAPFFKRFKTWAEVLAFMREGRSDDPRKDKVLRPIFRAHMEDGDPRWRQVLTVIFWPGLESIHRQKRHWDPNPEDRWQNIHWAFLEVLCRTDVEKRLHRLVQKVFNQTVRRLYGEYSRKWRRTGHESLMDPEDLDRLPDAESIGSTSAELREAQEAALRRLRRYLDRGHISEAGFLLLVGTRVYDKSLAQCAREVGLSYEAAKKRRQRAEATIASIQQDAVNRTSHGRGART